MQGEGCPSDQDPRVGRWSRRATAGREGWPPQALRRRDRIRRTGRLTTNMRRACCFIRVSSPSEQKYVNTPISAGWLNFS